VPDPAPADLEGLLHALVDAGVEFIVVGGVAAVLHGAPTTTVDLDIVHATSETNLDRLKGALDALGARIADAAGREICVERSHLGAGGQVRMLTDLGPVDALGQLHDGRGFEDLLPLTERFVDGDLDVLVLDLPTLIQVKSSTGRARDRLVVPILMALLDERGEA
jgi:hypothetical protein